MARKHRESGHILSVGDEHLARAVLDGVPAGSELGDHSRRRSAISDECVHVAERHVGDRRPITLEHTCRGARHDEPGGLQPSSQMRGQRICVHIEQLSIARGADAGHQARRAR